MLSFFCFVIWLGVFVAVQYTSTDDDFEVKFGNKQSMTETYYVYSLYNFIGGNCFLNT